MHFFLILLYETVIDIILSITINTYSTIETLFVAYTSSSKAVLLLHETVIDIILSITINTYSTIETFFVVCTSFSRIVLYYSVTDIILSITINTYSTIETFFVVCTSSSRAVLYYSEALPNFFKLHSHFVWHALLLRELSCTTLKHCSNFLNSTHIS